MKKRIAILSYHTCPLASEEGKETGGMNIYVVHTAKKLVEQGFIVDIFTRSQDPTQKKIVQLSETLRVVHIKAGPENYMLPNSEENKKLFFTSIPEFVENIKIFQKEQQIAYDILDCHYYLSGLAGLELKKRDTIPLLMTFHTLALMKNLVSRSNLSSQERERLKAEFLLTKEAQKIIAPSETEKKYLEYLYEVPAEKITVISPGVDTALFYPMNKQEAKRIVGASTDHKMILFVGRIDPVKGLDVLLYAMKIFLKKHKTIKACLWIVGGDTSEAPEEWTGELQKLEQLRQLLSLHTTVQFIKQQYQKNLPKYYNAADLVVMPSHYESFGMTALEAMACSTPVLTTNVTGVSELLDEQCQKHITTANNPLLLADKMAAILLHHKTSDDKAMLESLSHYDWKFVAEKIAEVYKQVLS
ncbi:MAG TPA: glycosyltransferase [Methylomirabilota bacterium]|nr:glycosyltransferase [Methylomirabilota bacterium]